MSGWRPIETAPKDGSHFLAWCVDVVDEEDDHGRVILRGVREEYAVVAYRVNFLNGEIVQMPWNGSIVTNRTFTHWHPLPTGPDRRP